MSEGKRPGGLTALAVLNFIFGGLGAIGALGLIAIMALLNVAAAETDLDENGRALADAWAEAGLPIFYLIVATTALSAFLLIASGVGYIKQKICVSGQVLTGILSGGVMRKYVHDKEKQSNISTIS